VAGCGADFDLLTVADTINNVDRRIFDDAEWAAAPAGNGKC
jgi:hypothetical protein